MARRKQTYCGNFLAAAIVPGAAHICSFAIISANRKLILKSVTWQNLITNLTTGLRVSDDNLTEIVQELSIGTSVIAGVVGLDYNSLAPPAPLTTDRRIYLYVPGQFFYNDIEFRNEIIFNNNYTNLSAANTYRIIISITVEIEDVLFSE